MVAVSNDIKDTTKRKKTNVSNVSKNTKKIKVENDMDEYVNKSLDELRTLRDGFKSRLDELGYVSAKAKAKAKEIKMQQDIAKTTAHWDYLLKEMSWMKKDFDTERKWKTSKQKLIAKAAVRVWENFSNREVKDQKQDVLRIRKIATQINKEVKSFWEKIDKVVVYKHQTEFFAKQQKAMDRHLNFIVEQTERYSNVLAAKLKEGQQNDEDGSSDAEEPLGETSGEEEVMEELRILRKDAKLSREERLMKYAGEQTKPQDLSMDDALNSDGESVDLYKTLVDDDTSLTLEYSDGEWEGEHEDDDEGTMDVDCETHVDEVQNELDTLKREAEMSREEILKQYGLDQSASQSETEIVKDKEGSPDDRDSEEDWEGSEEDDNEETMDPSCETEDVDDELNTLKREADMSREELMKLYGYGTGDQEQKEQPTEEELESSDAQPTPSVSSSNEDDWDGSEEEDNEETMDPSCETLNDDVEDELSTLKREAEMSQEELMKLYGYGEAAEDQAVSADIALNKGDTSRDKMSDSVSDDHDDWDGSEEEDDEETMDPTCETRDDEVTDELNTLKREAEMSREELMKLYGYDGPEVQTATTSTSSQSKSNADAASDDAKDDHMSESNDEWAGSEEDDDEETMDPSCETREDEVDDELSALKREAEMSQEELMKLYGYGQDQPDSPSNQNDSNDNIEYLAKDDADKNGESSVDSSEEWQGHEEEDDEGTMDQHCEPSAAEVSEELRLLKEEAEISLDELRLIALGTRSNPSSSEDSEGDNSGSEDLMMSPKRSLRYYGFDNFDEVHEENEEPSSQSEFEYEHLSDDEGTMDQDCEISGNQVDEELSDLKREAEMSREELLELYNARKTANDTVDGKKTVEVSQSPQYCKLPFLMSRDLKLREYQYAGLTWLASMCDKRLNGILADEMGLGKTVQTISLLAHLACEKGIWGPHLIIVPTSVLLNWEIEIKKFCPGFKVLTYYGSMKERKARRQGWSKPNSFHICITSYQLAVQDAMMFKRKKWYYLILDEAHNIKNFQSQRWQTLISLNTKRRLLLTGTPLQNSLMELWSLMHFLMPHIFRSHSEFKYWFANPLTASVEGGGLASVQTDHDTAIVKRLHAVMRPFLLRRLKVDVATQLPGKFEHIVHVPLSRRQRYLYEDFISRKSTQDALRNKGNVYLGMMTILMKLRMVCNHPDIFEPRVIGSALQLHPLELNVSSDVLQLSKPRRGLAALELVNQELELPGFLKTRFDCSRARALKPTKQCLIEVLSSVTWANDDIQGFHSMMTKETRKLVAQEEAMLTAAHKERNESILNHILKIQMEEPVYGADLLRTVTFATSNQASTTQLYKCSNDYRLYESSSEALRELAPTVKERASACRKLLELFTFVTPKAMAPTPLVVETGKCTNPCMAFSRRATEDRLVRSVLSSNPDAYLSASIFHQARIRLSLSFPDKMLVQYDCGKLQVLAGMLRQLKSGGHRVLIFTQMTKMLDILEVFLNIHGHIYFRLDGSTKVDARQRMMEKFNRDPRIFAFILSTRSGGLGINLTGADTVIFYDSDWNPSMDAQAQDRAHRIGQTRDVHIYRLISEHTIEENILLKSNQKRQLNKLSVEDGNFTVSSFLNDGDKVNDLLGSIDVPDIMSNNANKKAIEAAMAEVEDESDKLAAARLQEETKEDFQEFEENNIDPSTATESNDASQDSTLDGTQPQPGAPDTTAAPQSQNLTSAQFEAIESQLQPVERYAIEFRTTKFPVLDPEKVEAERKRLEDMDNRAWELDKLEAEKLAMEDDMDEELIVAIDGSEFDDCQFVAARQAISKTKKMNFLTGQQWDIYPDAKGRAFYVNKESNETTYDKPSILTAVQEQRLASERGWASLPLFLVMRVSTFLSPVDRLSLLFINKHWHQAMVSCPSNVLWVESVLGSCFRNASDIDQDWITVGTEVEALYLDGDVWYPGWVHQVHKDGMMDVVYTDGYVEVGLTRSHLRLDSGIRYPFVRPPEENASPYGVFSKYHNSRVGCGPRAPEPRRFSSLEEAIAAAMDGDTIVLQAGWHTPSKQIRVGNKDKRLRIIDECTWASLGGRYERMKECVEGEKVEITNHKVLKPPDVEVIGVEVEDKDSRESRKAVYQAQMDLVESRRSKTKQTTPWSVGQYSVVELVASLANPLVIENNASVQLIGIGIIPSIQGACKWSQAVFVNKANLALINAGILNQNGEGHCISAKEANLSVLKSILIGGGKKHPGFGVDLLNSKCGIMFSKIASCDEYGIHVKNSVLNVNISQIKENIKYAIYVDGEENNSYVRVSGCDLSENYEGVLSHSDAFGKSSEALLEYENNVAGSDDEFEDDPVAYFEHEYESFGAALRQSTLEALKNRATQQSSKRKTTQPSNNSSKKKKKKK